MPRDPSGTYSTPVGTDGIPNFPIESSKYNTSVHDVETDLNTPRPIVAGGTGASSATQALFNLSAETATQNVTSWDSQLWLPGSFYAGTSAIGIAPVTGHAFAGICYINEPLANPPTNQNLVLEATDLVNPAYPVKYIRVMTAGVWGAWKQVGAVPAAGTLGEFIFNSATTFPPASGEVRFNNATQNSTTELFISHLTATSVDITSSIVTLFVPGFDIIVQDKITPGNYKIFTPIGSLVTSGSDFRILVTFKSGGTNLVSTNRMLVSNPGNYTVRYDAPQTLTSGQQTQGRQNIYAAPFDAMEFNGMQINGSMGVSQENGLNVVTFLNGQSKYIVDGFYGYKVTAANITGQQSLGTVIGNGFYRSVMFVNAATAMSSVGTGDYVHVAQNIEGMRIAKLGWGTAVAQPVTIAFWTSSTIPGHASLAIQNGANDRSYVADYTVAGSNVWEYKVITIPGDVTGTWAKDNNTGIRCTWVFACGATFQTAANTWTAGAFIATPAQSNLLVTLGNQVFITGVTILPGLEAPSSTRASFIVRPADYELILCSRYLQTLNVASSYVPVTGLTNSAVALIPMISNMRSAPTVYLPWGDSNYNSAVTPTTWAFSTPGVANFTKSGTLTCTGFATQPGLATAIFYGATISGASTAINSGASIVPIKLDARL